MANRKHPRTVSQDARFGDLVGSEGFDAIGDTTRRSILHLLEQRPRTVGDLADELPVSRPAVSQHIKVLREAGLVSVDAQGTRRIVSLDPSGVAAMRDALDGLWRASLATFAADADADADGPATPGRR